MGHLVEVLQIDHAHYWRDMFMSRCLERLREGKSVPQALELLQKVIGMLSSPVSRLGLRLGFGRIAIVVFFFSFFCCSKLPVII
jgi:hypothetical protein